MEQSSNSSMNAPIRILLVPGSLKKSNVMSSSFIYFYWYLSCLMSESFQNLTAVNPGDHA